MANSKNPPVLEWKRPKTSKYPKIWYTFKARDIDSDNLVEYRIQDLPWDRVDDYYQHLFETFIPDEPLGQAFGYPNDPHVYDDYKQFWAPIIEQRIALVCFKEGSDEIIGTNLIFVSTQQDNYFEEIRKFVSRFCCSELLVLSLSFIIDRNEPKAFGS